MQAIVCVDARWGIGNQGQLLFHIPEDLKRFKALTMGHPILYGRKTLATFPGGRPLPGRHNYVLSHDTHLQVEGAVVLHSVDEAARTCWPETFVVGGAEVYRQMLPYTDTVYVTLVESEAVSDRTFPRLDRDDAWALVQDEPGGQRDGLRWRYQVYRRK